MIKLWTKYRNILTQMAFALVLICTVAIQVSESAGGLFDVLEIETVDIELGSEDENESLDDEKITALDTCTELGIYSAYTCIQLSESYQMKNWSSPLLEVPERPPLCS